MTDLERLGRHVGEVRNTEPRSYVMSCPHELREINDIRPGTLIPLHCGLARVRPRDEANDRAIRTRQFLEDASHEEVRT